MQDTVLLVVAIILGVGLVAACAFCIIYEATKSPERKQAEMEQRRKLREEYRVAAEQRRQEAAMEPKTPYRPKGCLVSLIEAALYLTVILICLAVALMCLVLI